MLPRGGSPNGTFSLPASLALRPADTPLASFSDSRPVAGKEGSPFSYPSKDIVPCPVENAGQGPPPFPSLPARSLAPCQQKGVGL